MAYHSIYDIVLQYRFFQAVVTLWKFYDSCVFKKWFEGWFIGLNVCMGVTTKGPADSLIFQRNSTISSLHPRQCFRKVATVVSWFVPFTWKTTLLSSKNYYNFLTYSVPKGMLSETVLSKSKWSTLYHYYKLSLIKLIYKIRPKPCPSRLAEGRETNYPLRVSTNLTSRLLKRASVWGLPLRIDGSNYGFLTVNFRKKRKCRGRSSTTGIKRSFIFLVLWKKNLKKNNNFFFEKTICFVQVVV